MMCRILASLFAPKLILSWSFCNLLPDIIRIHYQIIIKRWYFIEICIIQPSWFECPGFVGTCSYYFWCNKNVFDYIFAFKFVKTCYYIQFNCFGGALHAWIFIQLQIWCSLYSWISTRIQVDFGLCPNNNFIIFIKAKPQTQPKTNRIKWKQPNNSSRSSSSRHAHSSCWNRIWIFLVIQTK